MKGPFDSMPEVMRILRKPLSGLEHITLEEASKIGHEADIATVHLYQMDWGKRVKNNLLFLDGSAAQQVYLFLHREKVHYHSTNGAGSFTREMHNRFLELFLQNPQWRKKCTSVVLVAMAQKPISYLFHRGYAYVNHNIGSNYNLDQDNPRKYMHRQLAGRRIPYSEASYAVPRVTVSFCKEGRKTKVFQGLQSDLRVQRLEGAIKQGKYQ